MQTLNDGVRALTFLVELNRDRLIALGILGGALWFGAYISAP
ncbi:hypothetical protein AADZ90_008075 [Aestuariibius sp. 2305UL40-4]